MGTWYKHWYQPGPNNYITLIRQDYMMLLVWFSSEGRLVNWSTQSCESLDLFTVNKAIHLEWLKHLPFKSMNLRGENIPHLIVNKATLILRINSLVQHTPSLSENRLTETYSDTYPLLPVSAQNRRLSVWQSHLVGPREISRIKVIQFKATCYWLSG